MIVVDKNWRNTSRGAKVFSLTDEFLQEFVILLLLKNSGENDGSDATKELNEAQQDQDYGFGSS